LDPQYDDGSPSCRRDSLPSAWFAVSAGSVGRIALELSVTSLGVGREVKDCLAADAGHEVRDVRIAARPAHDHALEVLVAALADEAEVNAFYRVHAFGRYWTHAQYHPKVSSPKLGRPSGPLKELRMATAKKAAKKKAPAKKAAKKAPGGSGWVKAVMPSVPHPTPPKRPKGRRG
jgi:hypothetical protein